MKVKDPISAFLILAGIVLFVMYVAGFFDPYWSRMQSIYDPMINKLRFIADNGELTKSTEPCLVLTLAGQNAVKKREERCMKKGGEKDQCIREAWEWLYSKQPK